MKQLKTSILGLLLLAAPLITTQAQSPVGKNLHQIIGMWGDNFKRLTDASGMHILQYKRVIAKDTIADLLYLDGFTCVKEESIRSLAAKSMYIDSLNQQYKPAGQNSWLSNDSTFITMSIRDGLLNITYFSAAYYKKIAH
jgi:hypothetical protein